MSCHENSMLSVKELMIIIAFNLFFSHIFQYILVFLFNVSQWGFPSSHCILFISLKLDVGLEDTLPVYQVFF